jgi:hypothetical protein
MRSAAPPSPRRAGLAQAAGMLVGAWVLARAGHPTAATALRVVAALALAVAVAFPVWLADANRALGRALTRALLTAVYALVLLPTRLLLRALRVDPLEPRPPTGASAWSDRAPETFSPRDFERLW